MLTHFGFIVRCSHCGCWHTTIDPKFDGWQWWDHCAVGCGFTPHANSGTGLDVTQLVCEDEYDIRPVPEV